jgi:hypothetical protein
MLVSCLAYFTTLKMEAVYSSEKSVDVHWVTRRYTPEDIIVQSHSWKNLKYNRVISFGIRSYKKVKGKVVPVLNHLSNTP